LGEGFKTYYTLTVRFSDASGLLNGTDALLAGARIGKVAGAPKLLKEGDSVDVPLKTYDYIKIPEGTKFTVGSSGLLGDRFVNVIIPSEPPKGYLPTNAIVYAGRETGKVLHSATQGKGLVDTLLNDQTLANDLHALVTNLRTHGVLFYRDSAAGRQEKPAEQTQPTRQSRTR